MSDLSGPEMPQDGIGPPEPRETLRRIPLPVGVSINHLRERIPPSADLRVEFEVSDSAGVPQRVIFTVGSGESKYKLSTQVTYLVNNSGPDSEEVFLNPVNPPVGDGVPDESNIPRSVDEALATAELRRFGDYTLTIHASSQDVDVTKTIEEIIREQQLAVIREASREFFDHFREITDESLESIFANCIKEENLEGIVRGEYWVSALQAAFYQDAQKLFADSRVGGAPIDILKAYENATQPYLRKVKQVIEARVPQLHARVQDSKQLAFSIDKYDMEEENPDEGNPIVVYYVPKRGWSVSAPVNACSAAALRMFDSILTGRFDPGDEDNKVMAASIEEEGDALVFDRENGIVVYQDFERLMEQIRSGIALYHPGRPVRDALHVMRIAGEPQMSKGSFRQIIFEDTSEWDF